MDGAIEHIMINANDFDKAVKFYSWLMPKIGYAEKVEHGRNAGWKSKSAALWLSESEASLRNDNFDKRRVGLREIAFSADSKEKVDEIAKEVEKYGGKILDMPHDTGGKYQFFFTDPEGMKLEIIVRGK